MTAQHQGTDAAGALPPSAPVGNRHMLGYLIYILMCYGDDAEEAIVRAVNDTKDNDTAAAIVGAAVGGLHDASGLPQRWKTALTGRTGAHDDGRVFGLIEKARLWL